MIFLHHSTGQNIWEGGVQKVVEQAGYSIIEQEFPKDSPYGWENFPYDYWNIWVNHGDEDFYMQEPTLKTLADNYNLIAFKHCFPVGHILPDTGDPDVTSSEKTLENYKAQYNALKEKMHEYPDTKFLIWTGAALIESETDPDSARKMKEWVDWVVNNWDEEGDNIYVWDFYNLETEGSLYMQDAYSDGDSHPNPIFSDTAAPLFGERMIEVMQ
ncbi:hypothetical protein KKA57_04340 [Patescibacteria group bacterium]|nr:hypothetical protein [Patescibacteria group bacterium]